MYVVQLVGRMADQCVDMPFHVAQSNIANGTCRLASQAEILAAGLEVSVEVPALTTDSAFPVGYRIEPYVDGGYDLFEPGGVRLNTEPYENLAAARSAAIEAVNIHIAPMVPVEMLLSDEVIQSQIQSRRERTWTTSDYLAKKDEATELWHVFEPGGVEITEGGLNSVEDAKAYAAEHLRIMLEQGEGPDSELNGLHGEDREVVVPADWAEMHHMKIKALARLITGDEPANTAAARAAVEDYVRRQSAR